MLKGCLQPVLWVSGSLASCPDDSTLVREHLSQLCGHFLMHHQYRAAVTLGSVRALLCKKAQWRTHGHGCRL